MRRSVLIVDEDVDFCCLMRGYLKRKNYEVYCAHTLSDTFMLLQKQNIDVVLLPELFCNHEVEKQIKTLSPDTKVICMNGQVGWQESMRHL